ncbi:unnamed protein product [Hydatigera taeniaeformis]|uniref:SH2 domain-containing protein n=1 Tax=Hydatigena taeniaeformis TaxID=6205 RepID=A0A0R3X0M2_HYDTA|nr:unnamed protein product [Hydatigera taeniaeformis]
MTEWETERKAPPFVCELFGGFGGSSNASNTLYTEDKLPQYPPPQESDSLGPPTPPERTHSQFRHYYSPVQLGASPSPSLPSSTHLSITRAIFEKPLDCPLPPHVPPHLTGMEISPPASTKTFRADFTTEEGSSILPAAPTDSIISGEFVLIRQMIDDSNTPRVKQDTKMMVPVPLHATASLGQGPLIGPGKCRVTTESRQQAFLDGHFRLRRSATNSRRKEPKGAMDQSPPEPPKRTTSLRSGSTSTLASLVPQGPRQSSCSPIPAASSSEDSQLRTVPLYVANPLVDSSMVDSYIEPYLVSSSLPLSFPFTNNLPLTPIPESSEFSLRSSFASTAATGPVGSSNGSIPRSIARRIRDVSPAQPMPLPPSSLRSSLENNLLDQLVENQTKGGFTSPSSVGSSSLNEFLRLEEQESLTDDLEKQLLEGQEGDRSLVESVVEGMRNVEEGEGESTSLSRSLGPSILIGTDSASMLSSSFEMGPSFASLARSGAGMGGST